MPDPQPAGVQPPQGPPPPAPTTPVPPASVPPPTAVPPEATPPVPDPIPPISGDQRIQFQGKGGVQEQQTLQRLVDAYNERPDANMAEQLSLYEKSSKGDLQAASDLLSKFAGTPAAAAVAAGATDVPAAGDKALGERLEVLEKLIQGDLNPLVQQIRNASNLHSIQGAIESQKDKYPHLARSSMAAGAVETAMNKLRQLAADRNYDLSKAPPEILAQVRDRAFADTEATFKKLAGDFGVDLSIVAPVPATGPVSVNDQDPASVGDRPPRYQLNRDGVYFDTMAPGAAPVNPPLPVTPVGPVPAGGAPGVAPPASSGPMTPARLREMTRARAQTLVGTG